MLPARAIKKCSLLVVCVFLVFGNLGAQKLLDSIVTYYYASDRDSVNSVKIANEYNAAGQMTSHSIYLWDTNTNRWDGWVFCDECSGCTGRYEYDYDERGNQILSFGYGWQGHELGWVLRGRTENNYDDCGNNVSIIYSGWNAVEKEWTPGFGYEFGYDDVGRITSKITYDRGLPLKDWLPLEKMLYTFDGHGRKTQEIRQLWNETARDWVNQRKTEWYYDSPGITTEFANFSWTLTGKYYDWSEYERHRIVKVFDQADNRVLTTESVKASSTAWTPIWKEELAYNSLGQPVLSIISEGTGTLTERLRTEWVYDPAGRLILETLNGLLIRIRKPDCYPVRRRLKDIRSFDVDGDIEREIWYRWYAYTESLIFDRKDYYFYHSTSTGHQEIRIDPIRIDPNPASGVLNLSGLSQPAEVKIYSMQGMLLRSIHHVEVSVDISDLSPGAYLILVVEVGHPPVRTILIKE
ncbi:MAG: T9SS C-terminal target domain-containing protein [Porphyromonadaceae bacterium]|nr:MAG: T9SS C-terminal target domain-containing protein [Porphyromonadaceae bacterium]